MIKGRFSSFAFLRALEGESRRHALRETRPRRATRARVSRRATLARSRRGLFARSRASVADARAVGATRRRIRTAGGGCPARITILLSSAMSTSPSEEGDGLRRADSLPALRVVGFDLLRGSESAHEMHLLSQSGIASPAVSSPLSRLLGATTGKRERESPDGGGFFSAESSDSDAREAVAPLEKATSMDTIVSNVSNEAETIIFRHAGSFAAATPIDIPYRAGNQRHWRRCAFP